MRSDIMEYIRQKQDLHRYLREKPDWYRILSRAPEKLQDFEREAMIVFEKTLPQRIDKLSKSIQMGLMMYNVLQAMNNQSWAVRLQQAYCFFIFLFGLTLVNHFLVWQKNDLLNKEPGEKGLWGREYGENNIKLQCCLNGKRRQQWMIHSSLIPVAVSKKVPVPEGRVLENRFCSNGISFFRSRQSLPIFTIKQRKHMILTYKWANRFCYDMIK